jgi:hypothetical protein
MGGAGVLIGIFVMVITDASPDFLDGVEWKTLATMGLEVPLGT